MSVQYRLIKSPPMDESSWLTQRWYVQCVRAAGGLNRSFRWHQVEIWTLGQTATRCCEDCTVTSLAGYQTAVILFGTGGPQRPDINDLNPNSTHFRPYLICAFRNMRKKKGWILKSKSLINLYIQYWNCKSTKKVKRLVQLKGQRWGITCLTSEQPWKWSLVLNLIIFVLLSWLSGIYQCGPVLFYIHKQAHYSVAVYDGCICHSWTSLYEASLSVVQQITQYNIVIVFVLARELLGW